MPTPNSTQPRTKLNPRIGIADSGSSPYSWVSHGHTIGLLKGKTKEAPIVNIMPTKATTKPISPRTPTAFARGTIQPKQPQLHHHREEYTYPSVDKIDVMHRT